MAKPIIVEDDNEYLLALRNLRDKYPQYRTMVLSSDENPIGVDRGAAGACLGRAFSLGEALMEHVANCAGARWGQARRLALLRFPAQAIILVNGYASGFLHGC